MLNYLVFPGYKYLGGWNMRALPEEPSAIHFLCLLMFLLRHTFKDKNKRNLVRNVKCFRTLGDKLKLLSSSVFNN